MWIFSTISKLFCLLPKLLANWRNPRPYVAAAPADHRRHEIKMVQNLKEMLLEQENLLYLLN